MSEVRLIDGNTLRELVTDMAGKAGTKGAYAAVWKCARLIDTAPTITPESLGWRKEVHGRWVDNGRGPHCSECEAYLSVSQSIAYHNSYCPNCGARMDEELAGLLHQAYTDGVCDLIRSMRDVDAHVNTISDYQNWLKRPAKEEP